MTREPISDSALGDLLASLTHAPKGSAVFVLVGHDYTPKQQIRVAGWLDSHVRIARGRGGQTAEWKARALARIRELIATKKHDEAEAVQKAAAEFKYKNVETLRRYWRKERRKKRIRTADTESASL